MKLRNLLVAYVQAYRLRCGVKASWDRDREVGFEPLLPDFCPWRCPCVLIIIPLFAVSHLQPSKSQCSTLLDLGWKSLTFEGLIQRLMVPQVYLFRFFLLDPKLMWKNKPINKSCIKKIAKFIQRASHLGNNWKLVVATVG